MDMVFISFLVLDLVVTLQILMVQQVLQVKLLNQLVVVLDGLILVRLTVGQELLITMEHTTLTKTS